MKNVMTKLEKILCITFAGMIISLEVSATAKNPPTFLASDAMRESQTGFSRKTIHTGTKDCVTCTPQIAPGAPLEGNRTAALLTQVTGRALSKDESDFYVYLYSYCMTLADLEDGEKEFKKKIIEPMLKTIPASGVEKFWSAAGCEPNYIGATMSPLVHVIAENSTDRMQFLLYLKSYFDAKNDKTSFTKILNAKNTQGQTVLDYIQYAFSNRRFIKAEEAGLNKFVKFLCENGATYSVFSNKRCPAEYLSI